MKFSGRSYVVQGVGLAALILCAALAVWLIPGVSGGALVQPEQGETDFSVTDDPIHSTFPPDQNAGTPTPSIDPIDQLCQSYPTLTSDWAEKGYAVSDSLYDADKGDFFTLTKLNDSLLPNTFLAQDGDPAVFPRMGYLFCQDSTGQMKLLSYDGSPLLQKLSEELVFMGVRDRNGSPLFSYQGAYYTLLAQEGLLVAASYDEHTDDRGIDFDYPSYYGRFENEQNAQIRYSNGKYGFTVDGRLTVPVAYQKAYPFSEGLGCAVDDRDRLYFYNDRGRLPVGGLVNVLYGTDGDRSIAKLGYFYYVDGLTRASKREYARSGQLLSSREVLIRKNGDELALPQDYTLCAYSDGVILLEKGGYYGYMNSNGKWITNPIFTYARPFIEGVAVAGFAGGEKCVIDTTGELVFPLAFDEITDCSGGVMAMFKKDRGWFLANKLSPAAAQTEQAADEAVE